MKSIVKFHHRYPIYEIMDVYKQRVSLQPGKNRYTRYAKKFMIFCIEHKLKASKLAIDIFLEKEKITAPAFKNILNFFLDFCEQHGIVYFDNQTRFKGEHLIVLQYLAQNDFRNLRSKINYQNNVNAFLRYLVGRDKSFTHQTIREYFEECINRGLSIFTINTMLASIKSFTNWLLNNVRLMKGVKISRKEEFIKISKIKNYKLPQKLYWKDSLTTEQCNELLAKITNLKHKLAFSLQCCEGLRASEVCNLKLKDVDFEKNTVKVIGKGYHNLREIWLFPQTKQILVEYLMRNKKEKESKIFDKMSYQNLYKLVDKLYLKPFAKQKKIKLSLHSLRHTAAQIMVEKGVERKYIQQQLRHNNENSTQIYIQKYLSEVFLKQMPLI